MTSQHSNTPSVKALVHVLSNGNFMVASIGKEGVIVEAESIEKAKSEFEKAFKFFTSAKSLQLIKHAVCEVKESPKMPTEFKIDYQEEVCND